MSTDYAPIEIEPKWQAYWEAHRTFKAPNPGDPGFDPKKRKFYVLDMFPYPSGAGLHVGHPEGYTATDIVARYRRMRGDNVLHPMGWDAFGLPAEQHAVETGEHPARTTERNINTFRRQMKMLGFSYDWDREVATTDPSYYRWTQWIFLQLFNSWYDEKANKARPISEVEIPAEVRKRGEKAVRAYIDAQRLAYLAEVPVNWCPALGTVLSNEEVTNEGRSDRGNHPVYRRPMRQWMLRITKYADRLAEDLEDLDWPESVKLMQRNWVGRSEGAEVEFTVEGLGDVIEVFTTRPDTLFGATYMVLAPEHPLIEKITTPAQRETVTSYCTQASRRSELDRRADTKDKTGVDTGAFAINPVNGEKIPVWVANYVLMTYGTGAIMAVPAHDSRDFEFALEFELPMIAVLKPPPQWLADNWESMDAIDKLLTLTGSDQSSFGAEPAELAQALSELSGLSSKDCLNCVNTVFADEPTLPQTESLLRFYLKWPRCFLESFSSAGDDTSSIQSPPPDAGATVYDTMTAGPGETTQEYPSFNGLSSAEFKEKITAWLEECGLGRAFVNYKLRDWLFSRQRYWGEPFPILHGPDGELVALEASELPLELPAIEDYRPTSASEGDDSMPEPPLGRAKQWATVGRDGKTYRRELNTMPQWAGSCWYYLRFLDPDNDAELCGREAERYWMVSCKSDGTPHRGAIDLYLGGAEHAVLHLLYARFWHKVLYDLGHVSTPEPFGRLFNQGMIRAFAYRDGRGRYVGYEDIDFREDGAYRRSDGEKLSGAVEKMSKSLKNVINPEEVVREYGADSLRLYEMFMGPLDASKPWNPRDVPGVFRFLQRTWRLIAGSEAGGLSPMVVDDETKASRAVPGPGVDLERALHKTIKKVTEDIERLALNTAISAMMAFVNEAYRVGRIERSQAERFVLVLSAFAPHLCEELWQRLRGEAWTGSLAYEPWPGVDAAHLVEAEIEIPVQVNGKLAGRVTVAREADEERVRSVALADEKVAARIGGGRIVKTVYVPGRMLNMVVKK